MPIRNPIATDGFDFLEFATLDANQLANQFKSLGFLPLAAHSPSPVTIYQQNGLRLIINQTPDSQASKHAKFHGTSISAMGFKVNDARAAMQYTLLKGATAYQPLGETIVYDMPAIYGVGHSLIYFVDPKNTALPPSSASTYLHHVNFHLYRGHMAKWTEFFTRLFGFQLSKSKNETKTIMGTCGKIRINLTEPSKSTSATDEFLNNYNGEGVQHIALGADHTYNEIELTRDGLVRRTEAVVPSAFQRGIPCLDPSP